MLTLKLNTHEDLWFQCEVQNASINILINGSNAGSVKATGTMSATPATALGTYGALPGKNTLKLEISEAGKDGKLSCDFLNRHGISDEGKKIHHLSLTKKDLDSKSYILDFILDCKGYYPNLEPLFVELKMTLSKGKPSQDDDHTQMYMGAVRKLVSEANDEASAKKVLLEWISEAKDSDK